MVAGAGAAGVAVTDMLRAAGAEGVVVLDRRGVLHADREDLTPEKRRLAEAQQPWTEARDLAGALRGADVFIGVSGGTVPEEAVASMADDAIVFGLANPYPEVAPEVARRHAAVIATGRSDYPNQINNVLAFPGVFRGALDVAARRSASR